MKSKKLGLSVLLYNSHFVLVSFILTAIALRFVMVTIDTQERSCIIYGMSVIAGLSETNQEQELEVLEQNVKTAKVFTRGSSIVVNRTKLENIQVMATLVSPITQPGNYPPPLTAQKVGSLVDYGIVSIGPSTIIINVDVYKKVTLPAQDGATHRADPDYFVSASPFSSDTVVISDPEKEIVRIKKVSAEHDVKEALTQSRNFTTGLALYDACGEKLSTDKLSMSIKSVDVNITVLAKEIMKLSLTFTGKLVGLALSSAVQKVDPETAGMAGPEDVLVNVNELSPEAIDSLRLSINNQNLQVDITLPPGCKNLSNIYTTSVTLDFSGFKSKKVNMTDFQTKNLAASKSMQMFAKNLAMTLIGPAKQIDTIIAADAYAQIDMTGKESLTRHSESPITLIAKSHTSV